MSQHHFHAVIWIDHREARVFHFSPTDVEKLVLHSDHPTKHIHHKANSIGSGHVGADKEFLHAVVESVADAGAVLITGPANAKNDLVKHIHEHDPRLMKVIAGVETVDHPSDAELVAHARHYFTATDRMTPQEV
jgi:stalled ribosome rescue protein Dom34